MSSQLLDPSLVDGDAEAHDDLSLGL